MNHPDRPDFSFDTYGGVDEQLQAAFERQRTAAAQQAQLARELVLAAAASARQEAVQRALDEAGLQDYPEAKRAWMLEEAQAAIAGWSRYANALAGENDAQIEPALDPMQALRRRDFLPTLSELYDVRHDFETLDVRTPSGESVADSLHLVLIPWQAFSDHREHFLPWVNQLHNTVVAAGEQYEFDQASELSHALNTDAPIYHDWAGIAIRPVSTSEYIRDKVVRDGPWGIVLAQTTDLAGVAGYEGMSFDELTSNGRQGITVANRQIANLGILEWSAITLQGDPAHVSGRDYSLLLANSYHDDAMSVGFGVEPSTFVGDATGAILRLTTLNTGHADNAHHVRPVIFARHSVHHYI